MLIVVNTVNHTAYLAPLNTTIPLDSLTYYLDRDTQSSRVTITLNVPHTRTDLGPIVSVPDLVNNLMPQERISDMNL